LPGIGDLILFDDVAIVGIINLLKRDLNNSDWNGIYESIGGQMNKYTDRAQGAGIRLELCLHFYLYDYITSHSLEKYNNKSKENLIFYIFCNFLKRIATSN